MTLGRYELLAPVGAGGMACVWAARLAGYGGFSKLVAIKTVLPHLRQPDFENMLLDEARIAARASHPNVCSVFDVGEDDGVRYVVLEWVEGDSLLHLLRGGAPVHGPSLDYRIAARIVADTCAGLHAAHELVDESGARLNVVHRDVSPHNVLVSLEGTTKIADFGVAKAQGQLHQATRAGEIRGKVAYMAPEQIGGATVCPRADIFAAGCVLYHATIGRPPFRGDGDARVIRAVLDGAYDPPTEVAPDYPPELAAVIARALAPQPEHRFESAAQMGHAVEAWLATGGRAVTAADVGHAVRARIGEKLARRREHIQAALQSPRECGATRPVRCETRTPDPAEIARASVPPPPPGLAMKLLPPASLPPDAPPDTRTTSAPSTSHADPPPPALQGMKTALAIAIGLVTAIGLLQLRAQWAPIRPAAAVHEEDMAPVRPPGATLASVDTTTSPPRTVAVRGTADRVDHPAESAAASAPTSRFSIGAPARPPTNWGTPPDTAPPRSAPASPPPARAAAPAPPAKRSEIPANPY
jgi:serine/threonine-protein kinase